MRIALVDRYMRNWEKHLPNIKSNIIDKYSADVYITSYNYSELYMGSGVVDVDTDSLIREYQQKLLVQR